MMSKIFADKRAITAVVAGAVMVGVAGFGVSMSGTDAKAAGGGEAKIEHKHWSFGGVFGKYDKAQLQRGFQIYKEVCSSCHSLKRMHFRNLYEPGGPEFPEDRVKAMAAADYEVMDGPNDEGEMFTRPARSSDAFPKPFPNDNAARAANNGALPPDLSLITRARSAHAASPFYMVPWNFLKDVFTSYQESGADYVYALLTHYKEVPPKGVKLADGMHYNGAFPGNQIAMIPPLSKDNFIEYKDGSGSLEQNAEDITAFLAWAANPELNDRKSMGLLVMIYLLIMTVLLYLAKRRIWSKVPH